MQTPCVSCGWFLKKREACENPDLWKDELNEITGCMEHNSWQLCRFARLELKRAAGLTRSSVECPGWVPRKSLIWRFWNLLILPILGKTTPGDTV